MFDKLKQLSRDTAIYGISTMLGRFLNFLLVPFYTNIFAPAQYGVIANIYALIALMNIVYIYGMDAAYLKFASTKEVGTEKDNFSTPFLSVLLTSFLLSGLILLSKNSVDIVFSIPSEYTYLINYTAAILFLDAVAVIPFIKLRLERRPKRFALYKTLNIIINVMLNLYLILKLNWGIEAVFVSNLAASAFSLLLLLPMIIK